VPEDEYRKIGNERPYPLVRKHADANVRRGQMNSPKLIAARSERAAWNCWFMATSRHHISRYGEPTNRQCSKPFGWAIHGF